MDNQSQTAPESNKTPKTSEKWQKEIQVAEKALKPFWLRGRRVVKRYMDEAEPASTGLQITQNAQKYNVFWSNVGVLKAALYANPPKPLVKREFDDFQDQVARVAAEIMQRLLTQPFEKPESDMNMAFYKTVEDRLIPGLGQVWLRYVPEIETTEYPVGSTEPLGVALTEALTVDHVVTEVVATDYIYWEDFLWSPCRTWEECRWVARRVHMTKKEFTDRFGAEKAKLVPWSRKPSKDMSDRVTPEDYGIFKTEVYEIWNKIDKTVYWVSQNCDLLLDEEEDPLEIQGFFPCPRPLFATTTTSSTIPKADYLLVQSQYRRLDNLTMRIGMLEDAIQASGVYDKANKELSQILSGNTNKMIPVDNWAVFADKGGIKGVVDWFPLEMVVNALDKLRELKIDAKAELYELTGISDIMRGTTAPRETATAQNLKAQFSSVRLQFLQGEVSIFIQEALRIKAEIIAHRFQPETIIRASLIELTPDAELAPQAVALIKDTWQKHFRIQVFAHDLAIPDYNAERQGRTEFIQGMGQYLSQVQPLIQMEPKMAPFLMQILQWGVSSFRSAQSIEGVFSKAVLEVTKLSQQPKPPPPPDPKLLAVKAKIEGDQQAHVQDMQQDQQKHVQDMQQNQQEFEQKMMLEGTDAENRNQAEMIKIQGQQQAAAIQLDAATQKAIIDAVTAAMGHQQKMQQNAESHQQTLQQTKEMAKVKPKNDKT